LWPNGWVDQDATWHGSRPRYRPHCVRWGVLGDPAPSPKGHSPPVFGPCLLWPNSWMDQDATWYEGRPWPRPHCVTWRPSPPAKRGTGAYFRPMSIVVKQSPISVTAEHLLHSSSFYPNPKILCYTVLLSGPKKPSKSGPDYGMGIVGKCLVLRCRRDLRKMAAKYFERTLATQSVLSYDQLRAAALIGRVQRPIMTVT